MAAMVLPRGPPQGVTAPVEGMKDPLSVVQQGRPKKHHSHSVRPRHMTGGGTAQRNRKCGVCLESGHNASSRSCRLGQRYGKKASDTTLRSLVQNYCSLYEASLNTKTWPDGRDTPRMCRAWPAKANIVVAYYYDDDFFHANGASGGMNMALVYTCVLFFVAYLHSHYISSVLRVLRWLHRCRRGSAVCRGGPCPAVGEGRCQAQTCVYPQRSGTTAGSAHSNGTTGGGI